MTAFRYRLQPLLDERIETKKKAEETLAARQSEMRSAERELERLEERVRKLGEKQERFRSGLLDGAGGTLSGRDAGLRRDYLRGLGQDAETARDACFSQRLAVNEATDGVAAARRELAERTREVEVLQKHRGRLEERFRREAERKEALEEDEIGNMLYMSRRRAT